MSKSHTDLGTNTPHIIKVDHNVSSAVANAGQTTFRESNTTVPNHTMPCNARHDRFLRHADAPVFPGHLME